MPERSIHDEVRTALDEWWAGIVPILGPRIKSVILSGSGAEGDYAPAVSDIDLYAVVDPPLQRSESGPVEAWHEPKEVTPRGRPGYWREIMTLQYLPPAMVSNPRDSFEYLSVRPRSTWWVTRNMSPFSRFTIIRHGYCYRGEPVTFAPPTEKDLLDNIEREMNRWVAGSGEKLKDTRWVADKVNRMARSLAFLHDGSDLSKTAALKRAMETAPEIAQAASAALRYRQVGEGIGDNEREELLAGFQAARGPVTRTIQELLAVRRQGFT